MSKNIEVPVLTHSVDTVSQILIVLLSKTTDSIANYSASLKSAIHVVFDAEIHTSQNNFNDV
jgi:hypothetical protein